MNDFDLESKLNSVRVPERSDEYWEDFPSRIRGQLRRERPTFAPRRAGHPHLRWAGGLVLATAMVWVCVEFRPLQTASLAIAKQHRQFHAQLARLNTGLHKLMLNTDGMGYLLAEPN